MKQFIVNPIGRVRITREGTLIEVRTRNILLRSKNWMDLAM